MKKERKSPLYIEEKGAKSGWVENDIINLKLQYLGGEYNVNAGITTRKVDKERHISDWVFCNFPSL